MDNSGAKAVDKDITLGIAHNIAPYSDVKGYNEAQYDLIASPHAAPESSYFNYTGPIPPGPGEAFACPTSVSELNAPLLSTPGDYGSIAGDPGLFSDDIALIHIPSTVSPIHFCSISPIDQSIRRRLQDFPYSRLDPEPYRNQQTCCQALHGTAYENLRLGIINAVMLAITVVWLTRDIADVEMWTWIYFIAYVGIVSVYYSARASGFRNLIEFEILSSACCFTPKSSDELKRTIARFEATEPTLSFQVECWHNETSHVSSYNNQTGQTTTSTSTERVTTHRETIPVPIAAWRDASPRFETIQQCIDVGPSAVVGVTYFTDYFPVSDHNDSFWDWQAQLRRDNRWRDVNCDVSVQYNVKAQDKTEIVTHVIKKSCDPSYIIPRLCCFNRVFGTFWLGLCWAFLPVSLIYRRFIRNVPYTNYKVIYVTKPWELMSGQLALTPNLVAKCLDELLLSSPHNLDYDCTHIGSENPLAAITLPALLPLSESDKKNLSDFGLTVRIAYCFFSFLQSSFTLFTLLFPVAKGLRVLSACLLILPSWGLFSFTVFRICRTRKQEFPLPNYTHFHSYPDCTSQAEAAQATKIAWLNLACYVFLLVATPCIYVLLYFTSGEFPPPPSDAKDPFEKDDMWFLMGWTCFFLLFLVIFHLLFARHAALREKISKWHHEMSMVREKLRSALHSLGPSAPQLRQVAECMILLQVLQDEEQKGESLEARRTALLALKLLQVIKLSSQGGDSGVVSDDEVQDNADDEMSSTSSSGVVSDDEVQDNVDDEMSSTSSSQESSTSMVNREHSFFANFL